MTKISLVYICSSSSGSCSGSGSRSSSAVVYCHFNYLCFIYLLGLWFIFFSLSFYISSHAFIHSFIRWFIHFIIFIIIIIINANIVVVSDGIIEPVVVDVDVESERADGRAGRQRSE